MDQIQLQQKIAEYYQKLPKEAQSVFSSMLWMEKLKELGIKYGLKENRIEILATETTLVLLGIIHIEEYQNILRKDLELEKEVTEKILIEIDENILKTIKGELTETFQSNAISLNNKNLDLRFASLPKDIQESIAYSNWKEKLYDVARKYKINVEQMGILEDITVKVILNTIAGNQYEDAIRSKIDLGNDKIQEMVGEINENIFKNIKNVEEEGIKVVKNEKSNDEVPLPPYAKKKEEVVPIPSPVFSSPPAKGEMPEGQKGSSQSEIENIIANTNTKETDMYKEHGIEIISDDEKSTPTPNIITNKLFGNTTSKASVSDYSLPKMSGEPQSKPHDPYHEEI
ncbi:MAG: hypothetical protein WCW54_01660 [Candidatus Paceibacterota bacterium]